MSSRPALAIACCAFAVASAAQAGGLGGVEPLTTVRIIGGLNRPIFATHAPGDPDRLFIIEQRGVILVLDLNSNTLIGTFLDIDALVPAIAGNDERGLLGLAFHPDYADNGFFYVYYTNLANDETIIRYTVSANPNVANAGSAFLIMTMDDPQANHNGGWIGFGPNDGYLYIATGDGGNFCDQGAGHSAEGNAQDVTTNLLGKMLRIDVDGGSPYVNPPSNPFVGFSGDDEIWAYGLRNPWRSSFDRETGDLYIADVGQDQREEINFQPGDSTGRENYGWRCFEGNSCSSISGCPTTPCACSATGLTAPIHTYTHGTGICISGGYVYRGCDIPSLRGHYFFADFVFTHIWSFRYDGTVNDFVERTSELSPSSDGFSIGSVASFGEDANGEVYIVDRGSTTTGEIFKIVPETPASSADIDCDGIVGINDLLLLLASWGKCPGCPEDIDGDGVAGITDLLDLLAQWT